MKRWKGALNSYNECCLMTLSWANAHVFRIGVLPLFAHTHDSFFSISSSSFISLHSIQFGFDIHILVIRCPTTSSSYIRINDNSNTKYYKKFTNHHRHLHSFSRNHNKNEVKVEFNVHGFCLSNNNNKYEQFFFLNKTTRFQLIFAIHFYDNSINSLIRIKNNRLEWMAQARRYSLSVLFFTAVYK